MWTGLHDLSPLSCLAVTVLRRLSNPRPPEATVPSSTVRRLSPPACLSAKKASSFSLATTRKEKSERAAWAEANCAGLSRLSALLLLAQREATRVERNGSRLGAKRAASTWGARVRYWVSGDAARPIVELKPSSTGFEIGARTQPALRD